MWLIVGGDSEIGATTQRYLSIRGHDVLATTRRRDRIATDRIFLDLADPLGNWEPPSDTAAACIFVAIARLASCAADPVGSAHVNVTQTLAFAQCLMDRGIYVLFLSTNQVFDGSVPQVPPHTPVCPVSEYGRQKARAEAGFFRCIDAGAPAAILRLAKVVSPDMPLVRGWATALRRGERVRAFHDMTMAPVPTDLVACAIERILQDRGRLVFQLTGPRDLTYADVATFIAHTLGADPGLVTKVSAAELGLPEGSTPRYTTLDTRLLKSRYGIAVPDGLSVTRSLLGGCSEDAELRG